VAEETGIFLALEKGRAWIQVEWVTGWISGRGCKNGNMRRQTSKKGREGAGEKAQKTVLYVRTGHRQIYCDCGIAIGVTVCIYFTNERIGYKEIFRSIS